ncbi:MAG: hypothetical protein Ct9H300mP32_2150 [Verrucomicrobiota bacterium]|nr:MAG: hypothetical protein Ct9H300mP32_2150 [Verrucomicrobiota bacterium]
MRAREGLGVEHFCAAITSPDWPSAAPRSPVSSVAKCGIFSSITRLLVPMSLARLSCGS